jgi:preprotein translocase subunit SecA
MGLEDVTEYIGKAARVLFGSRNERLVRAYRQRVASINALELQMQALADEQLLGKARDLRGRAAPAVAELDEEFSNREDQGDPKLKAEYRQRLSDILDPILPEAFAAVREAAKRTIWLGYEEAPPDFHPEVQDRIRKAMRGEASLIDPATGKPIDLFGLYGMRPYDAQLIGAMVLNDGRIAELATGEGKTLVASLAAFLNALTGHQVHVVSVNDYLVRRDCNWNRPIFRRLGLTVGAIQANMDSRDRQVQYACDITYGTNNEFGFDYLRDNMKISKAEQVQGELAYAIVDECDSVLIDEARTPLIISGPAFESTDKYAKADAVARQLRPERDFLIKEKEHQCPMTEEGGRRAEELIGAGSFYVAGNMDWPHLIDQALRAHNLYRRDKDYVVKGDEVIIVDEFTGRLMPGRQWSDGLHQAVEAKERIRIKEETQTLATITLQNFFRMYKKLSGMTGTAMTEAAEFDKIYQLEVVAIPTNRPLSRIEHADVVYRSGREKYEALVEEIKRYHDRGRPVLVGTTSIENSERLSHMLERTHGIPHEVLNAKFHEKEAEIVAKAGQQHVGPDGKMKGNVTIATNMAGRGTDIKLGPGVVWTNCFGPWDLARQVIPSDFGNKCCVGCPEYDPKTNCAHCFKPKADPDFPERGRNECLDDPPCGLHVVGTERHEARRIDNQLRGRAGRQGDPGSGRFFLALEDDLMRIFAKDWVSGALQKLGMEEGMALEHRWLSRGIENAQKKVEERNFDIRKHLLEYDEVMDRQRKIFYGRRQNILEADDLRDFVWEMLTDSAEAACDSYLSPGYSYETVAEWARRNLAAQVDAVQLEGKSADELVDFLQDLAQQTARDAIEESLPEFLPEEIEDTGEPYDEGDEDDEGEEEEDIGPPPKADYRALAAWAETRLSVRLREADLKKLGRDEIQDLLVRAADERLKAVDFSPIQNFLKPDYRLAALADWANKKFDFRLTVADFQDKDRDAAVQFLLERLEKLYQEKERSYPIESAIEEHLVAQAGMGQQDFDGLAKWASWYYLADVRPDGLRHRDPREVRRRLLEIADEFYASNRLGRAVDEGIRRHLPAAALDRPESWHPLAQWAKERLGVEITPDHFIVTCAGAAEGGAAGEKGSDPFSPSDASATPDGEAEKPLTCKEAVTALLAARGQALRRSRMTELERYLLLQVHDTSWKDHLLVMDHLKSGVGLRGYAQLNPLIEFKKEGLESFERMLDSAREKFTDLFFKARWVRQEALARIWAGQSTEHAVAASAYDAQREAALQMSQRSQMADEGETVVKTIVRQTPKVGRNDPCPCGSGKKYKKCCGARA